MNVLDVGQLTCHRRPRGIVLRELTFELGPGQALCVLGPNGAGKTTLLNCLLGLESGWSGSIRLMGTDLRELRRGEIARRIAYVPQASGAALSFSAEEMVLMGPTTHLRPGREPGRRDHAVVEAALAQVGALPLRSRAVDQLSGGEQQLVLIARALAQECPVIALDEPTASLDLSNQAQVLRTIRQLTASGRAVILTTHLPEQAFLLESRVMLLKEGRLVGLGSPGEICTEGNLAALYGTDLLMLHAASPNASIAACVPRI